MPARGWRHGTLLGRRRTGDDGEERASVIDLTPMIDVTILLLIFFMVTSTLAARAKVDLPRARYGRGVDPQSATSILVLESPEPSGAPAALVERGGRDAGGAPLTLDEVSAAVAEGLAEGRTRVVIKAHRRARWRDVEKVTRRAAVIEGTTLHFGVREKD